MISEFVFLFDFRKIKLLLSHNKQCTDEIIM